MKRVWIGFLGLMILGSSPVWSQSPSFKSPPSQKVQIEKKEPTHRTDRFRDKDRDGVNDRVRKRHKERMNRSFLKALEKFLR